MIELAVAREIAAPAAPDSRHFEAPRWWPEWVAQTLAGDRPPAALPRNPAAVDLPAATPFAAAAAALREALDEAAVAAAAADAWAATASGHRVYLARRALRTLLDAAVGSGPGTRLEWCTCGEETAAR